MGGSGSIPCIELVVYKQQVIRQSVSSRYYVLPALCNVINLEQLPPTLEVC